MAHIQSGIRAQGSTAALYLTLWLKADAPAAVVGQLAVVLNKVVAPGAEYADAGLHAVVAFSGAVMSKAGVAVPQQMKAFVELGSGDLTAPATGGDVFVHVHSNRTDLNFAAAREILAALYPHVERADEVSGFRYLDERDLTGFIDGTENPEGEEREEVAGIADDAACSGGSFVLAQRYVHKLDEWNKLSDDKQEGIIGRTKPDSVELDDDVRPDTAHISRVVIEEDGDELEIVRHSLPYGTASGEQGLQFLAYSADISIFERMLANMFGTAGDGRHDHLMNYTRAVTGAYFYAPGVAQLDALAAKA